MKPFLLWWAALASILFGQEVAGGTDYRVGPGCPYTTIQSAIDAIPIQGSGFIRIRSGTYNERLVIANKTIEMWGGHADCTTAGIAGTTTIDGSGGSEPVVGFRVVGGPAGSSHTLTMLKINLIGGTGNALAHGGGINVWTDVDRSATVTLQQVLVQDNQTAYRGGAVALAGDGSGTLNLFENTRLVDNSVTGTQPYGGGLYCQGNYNILMIGGLIRGNTAGIDGETNGRGGGIYLDGCDMEWYSGPIASGDLAALRNNFAYGSGGGLFATGGANVDLIGAHYTFGGPVSTRPLTIAQNRAWAGAPQGKGGAIYAIGSGTVVTVDRSLLHDNHATRYGGAISVQDATVVVERSSPVCHDKRNCSVVEYNSAPFGGGAVFVWTGGQAIIRRSKVLGNHVSSDGPIAVRGILAATSGGQIYLEDSLVAGTTHHGRYALALDDAFGSIDRSTIAHTQWSVPLAVFGLNGSASLQLYDSIVHDQAGVSMVNVHGGSPAVQGDCIIWHDDALLALGVTGRTEVADPLFVDWTTGKFYLQPGSPAINFCDYSPPAPGVDLEWNPRGLCHSSEEACGSNVYDVGAYELPLLIFSDRFEDTP